MIPVDHSARTRAATALGASIALSAGAGSGKTSVLTQRVVNLLASGVPPARIAAVTFTEKAAGELQVRVRDALERALSADDTPVLRGALDRLPELTLSTIHSFCQRLLVAEALEAGWAPDTELLPSLAGAPAVARAWAAWEAALRREQPDVGVLVRHLVSERSLREASVDLLAYRDLGDMTDPTPFSAEEALASLRPLAADLERAASACRAPATCKLLAAHAALRALLATLDGPADVVRLLASGEEGGALNLGRKGDWEGEGKQAFADAVLAVRAWRRRQLGAVHAAVVRALREGFLPAVEAARAEAGVASFDDLLFGAAALLARDAPRRRLAARFDAILIDEVQDTDPIQAEVAALLTRDVDVTGPWTAAPPRPGHLFAVGDPNQSIYRFRRADVETWGELRALVAADGEALALTQNFRSVPGVVSWVARAFPEVEAQTPWRGEADLTPVVRLVPEADTEAHELDAVARYLHHLRATGHVVDREDGALRPARWSDLLLLLPAWSRSEALRAHLTRAGIPCVVEGGGAFTARDEVRLCVAALTCLEDPAEERATLLVLRGLFGLDWDTLARHRAAGGSWRFTAPDPPPGPVADALRTLAELSRLRGRRPWVELLDALLDRTRAAATWAALRDGEARLANVDKVRALIRGLEARARAPGDVVRGLDALDAETDLSRVDLDSDAVRITSLFKAKGLEAPVVVLCLQARKLDSVSTVVDRRARRVALRIGPLAPSTWEEHEAREKAALLEERRRWMYVAATRARDQLVLVDRDGARLVHDHLADGLALATPVDVADLPAAPVVDETFPGHDAAVDGLLAAPPAPEPDPTDAWREARRAEVRAARAACTRWRTVQELATRGRRVHAPTGIGAAGGVVVHEVMAALDLSRPRDALTPLVDGLVAGVAAEHGLDADATAACARVVHQLLAHPALDRARAAPERWVEVPFSYRDGARVISGRVDLAFPTDATRTRWVVVDWKSDAPAPGSPAHDAYARQLALYADALLRTVTPCAHVETVLVGPHPALGPTVDEDALGEVLPELAPGLQALLDAGVAPPRVGGDVGAPIVALAELAWDDHRVALCVGQPADEVAALRRQGWTVVAVDPEGAAWAEHALAALREVLPGCSPASAD